MADDTIKVTLQSLKDFLLVYITTKSMTLSAI